MAHQEWLAEILFDAREEVQKWPEWKRSDDVKREFPKLYAGRREKSENVPASHEASKEKIEI